MVSRVTVLLPTATSGGVDSTPSLQPAATPVYNASIGPDGTIKGLSNDTNTPMRGQVTGTRMTGQIDGLLCNYAFTAERG